MKKYKCAKCGVIFECENEDANLCNICFKELVAITHTETSEHDYQNYIDFTNNLDNK